MYISRLGLHYWCNAFVVHWIDQHVQEHFPRRVSSMEKSQYRIVLLFRSRGRRSRWRAVLTMYGRLHTSAPVIAGLPSSEVMSSSSPALNPPNRCRKSWHRRRRSVRLCPLGFLELQALALVTRYAKRITDKAILPA